MMNDQNSQKNVAKADKQMRDDLTKIEEIKNKVKAFQDKRGWGNESPKDISLSIVLEAAELLEHFQFKSGREVEEEARLFGPICDELSDVLWWIMSMANRLDIDVAQAFARKYKYNEEKYPESIFASTMTDEEKRKKYYKIKAKYRGSHPLADKQDD